MKFDHIGIVVKNLEAGRVHLTRLLNLRKWTRAIIDPVNGVYAQFGLDDSGICYEVLAPHGSSSAIAPALENKRAIINHVAYLVEDIDAAARRLLENRCLSTGPAKPGIAYGNSRIQFFISPMFFILELIEAPAHEHSFEIVSG